MDDTPDDLDHGDEPITWDDIDAVPHVEAADIIPAPFGGIALAAPVGLADHAEPWRIFDPRAM